MTISVRTSINGAPAVAGSVTIVAGDTVDLSLESYSGVRVIEWEVFAYPEGWTPPAGWTKGSGRYFWNGSSGTSLTPPQLDFTGAPWGKWLFRATINYGLGAGGASDLRATRDDTVGAEILGPGGLEDPAVGEEQQFDDWRQQVGSIQGNFRKLATGTHSVLAFGADPTGVADSTAAIQAAIDAASAAGGGIVHLPAGTYLVHLDPADYSEAPSDRRVTALVVRSSGVRIVGAGIGITTIRCTSADGAYGVLEFAQLPIENGVVKLWDCAVRNITLDGNRDSAAEPTHRASVLNCKGTARLDVEHVQVIRSAYYGIGFQNGGFQKCRVHHVLIENVGGDGIDIKDNGAISEAFEISDLWISNFGRLTDPFSFAGLDVASLAPRIRGIHITGFGAEGTPGAALRLKQGTDLAARGWGPQWAVVSDVIVEQTNPTAAGVQGVRINSGLVALSNVHVNGVTGTGIRVEQSHVRASNVLVNGESSATGIYLRARSLAADEQPFEGADDCVFGGVTIIGCDRGIHNSRKRNSFSAVKLHDCATGVYGDSEIEAMSINGIAFSGTVTTPWSIGGTRHQITDVSGAIGPYDGIITTASEPRTRTHHSYSGFRWFTGYTGDPATADEFLRLAPASTTVSWQLQGGDRDFVLAPSGTGKVRFGAVEAAADGSGESLVLGIKDAGGAARKVVIADTRAGVHNVLAYGADPTGVSDSTAAFLAAAAAINAAGRGTFQVPDGHFVITAPIAFAVGNVTLRIAPGALIDASSVQGTAANGIFEFGSHTIAQYTTATVDIASGDRDVTVADSSMFAAGDIVAIMSDDEYFGGIVGASGFGRYPKGELSIIRDVPDATTVTLEAVADDSYSVSGYTVIVGKVPKIENVTVDCEGRLIGWGHGNDHSGGSLPAAYGAIYVRGVKGVTIKGLSISNFGRVGVSVEACMGVRVTNCTFEGRRLEDATNLPYVSPWFTGCGFSGCTDVIFSDNTGRFVRRHFDTGALPMPVGGDTYYLISRNLTVADNRAYSCREAIGAHISKNVTYSGNRGYGCLIGSNFRGKNVTYIDNDVGTVLGTYACYSIGGATNQGYDANESPNVGHVTFIGNRGVSSFRGVAITADCESFVSDGNHIRTTGEFGLYIRGRRNERIRVGPGDVYDFTGRGAVASVGVLIPNAAAYRITARDISIECKIVGAFTGVAVDGASADGAVVENISIDCKMVDVEDACVDWNSAVYGTRGVIGEASARVNYLGVMPATPFKLPALPSITAGYFARRPAMELVQYQRKIGYGTPAALVIGETAEVGDVLTDQDTGVEYYCVASGTKGVYDTTRITIDSGDASGVVTAEGAAMHTGSFVRIAGAGAAGADLLTRVTAKDLGSNAVTFADAASTSVADAVADFYPDPVFKARGSSLAVGHTDLSHTGDTNETVLVTIPIPANMIGKNGVVNVTTVWTYPSTASAKTLRLRLGASGAGTGGTVLYETSPTTTQGQTALWHFRNMNDASVQRSQARNATGYGASGTGPSTAAIDTTADTEIVLTAELADAGETITLRAYEVEIIYRD